VPVAVGLIFGLVIVLIVLLIWSSVVTARKRREAFFALSVKLGLRYDVEDPFNTVDLPFALFRKGDSRGVDNVLSGEAAGMRVRLFDYHYTVTSTDSKGHSSSSTYPFSCAIGEIDADCPHLVLERESFMSRLSHHLGFHDIEMESEEFNKSYLVASDDKKFAYAMLDGLMMQWLIDEGGICEYEVIGPLVLCVCKRVKPEEYENLLEVLRRFHSHVPAVVASLYPRQMEGRT
jgi:hypothetical protein